MAQMEIKVSVMDTPIMVEMGMHLMKTTLALNAAISLLENGNKKGAASDKMFDAMLADHKAVRDATMAFVNGINATVKPERPIPTSEDSNINLGHGHVYKRPDRFRARCGGPGLCDECSKDLAKLQAKYK